MAENTTNSSEGFDFSKLFGEGLFKVANAGVNYLTKTLSSKSELDVEKAKHEYQLKELDIQRQIAEIQKNTTLTEKEKQEMQAELIREQAKYDRQKMINNIIMISSIGVGGVVIFFVVKKFLK